VTGRPPGSHEAGRSDHDLQAAGVGSKGNRIDPERSSASMRLGFSCLALMLTEVVV
jgi:hypothetical protein